ncbi:LptF/LptG family permease [Candidatus Sumerlaeota bacterium]|nr:LptF/LptG family permease [Candidatus Sumerlaeota bacterium]
MKIIDRYILREYLYSFIGVIFICAIVLLVYMLIENYEEILKNNPETRYVVLYFLYSLPYNLTQVVPLAVAIAILYTIGQMARHNELIAIVAAGISTKRVSSPIILSTLGICWLTLIFNELVVPGCQERAGYIEKAFIEGKGEKILTRNKEIFVKGKGQRFYIMETFDSRTKIMTNPSVIDLNASGSSLAMRVDADKAQLIEESEGGGRFWRFENARRWIYDRSGMLSRYEKFDEPINLNMEEDLDKFLSNRKKPEEMNIFELRKYVNILQNRGESVEFYKTDYHLKMAFPFASLIIALICYCFAIRIESRNLVLGYALGITSSIAFYAFTALTQALGHHLIFPPIVAGWTPNILFGAIGIYILNRLTL